MDRPKFNIRKSKTEHGVLYLSFRMWILLVLWALIAVITSISKAVENKKMTIVSMPHTIWLKKLYIPHDSLKVYLEGPIDMMLTRSRRDQIAPSVGVRVEWRDSKLSQIFVRSPTWNVYLEKNESKYTKVSKSFEVYPARLQKGNTDPARISNSDWALAVSVISVQSKSDRPVGLKMTVNKSPMPTGMDVIYGLCLILILYAMIITEYIDRYFGSLLLCSAAVSLMAFIGHKPNFEGVLGYVSFGTLMIILGSLLMVNLLSETGFFDYISLLAYRISRGNTWLVIFLMCMFAATMSAILENATVVLLLAPASVRMCEATFINTKIVLIMMAIYANMGGSCTPVGVPPNIIVANDPAMEGRGLHFKFFMGHMLPVSLICMVTVFGLIFCCVGGQIYKVDKHQLARRRALKKPTPEIKERIKQLKRKIETGRRMWLKPEANYYETLAVLEANLPLMNMKLMAQFGVAVSFTVFCFLLNSMPTIIPPSSLGWITMLAAYLLLILANQSSISPLLARIEWGVLLYLTGLLILTDVIADLGLIFWLGRLTTAAVRETEAEIHTQTITGMMIILWTSALMSAIIDNSVVATILLKLCIEVSQTESTAVPLTSLVWAMLLGTNCGGNGTLLGSLSNEFISVIAMQHGYNISFMEFFYMGFPITLVTVVICSLYLFSYQNLFDLYSV